MIIARDVSKSYCEKCIIKNFNYEFKEGIYLITGSSGCGKTTILNILSKEDNDFNGEVICDSSFLYIKDKNNLVNDLTVYEHYILCKKTNGYDLKMYFDVKHLLKKKIKKLSLGEKQLVILNIVLNCSEKNIILDEPFSALNINNVKKAIMLFKTLLNDKTIIVSTHDKEFFCDYNEINLESKIKGGCSVANVAFNYEKKENIGVFFKYFYIKKIIFKKIFFVLSFLFTIFGFVYLNMYLNKNFSLDVLEIKENDGVVIGRDIVVNEVDENNFYEVVKQLEEYVVDYNANYYNLLLYKKEVKVDDYYIDNGFVFSSVKYAGVELKENEVLLGVNYSEFCLNNKIMYCDENYIKMLLVNKEIEDFNVRVKDVFNNEENVVLSNNRFYKVYEDNEYEEYYFDILKINENEMFKVINNSEYLSNFKFSLIGENEEYLRYKVEKGKYFEKNIPYEQYVVCLEKGYNCLNYFSHFESLVAVEDFEKTDQLDLKLSGKKMAVNEIIISSKLSDFINKTKGDSITLHFNYDDEYKKVSLVVIDVVDDNSFSFYQNSDWSYLFFEQLVGLSQKHLRIENIIIHENIKDGYHESDDVYKNMLLDFKGVFLKTKRRLLYLNVSLTIISLFILIILEVYQNKFKKEYYRFLKMIDVFA